MVKITNPVYNFNIWYVGYTPKIPVDSYAWIMPQAWVIVTFRILYAQVILYECRVP